MISKEPAVILAELRYDNDECNYFYNTVTDSWQEFSSAVTVCWPYNAEVLRWFRTKGYKYSIIPAVLSNTYNYEVYEGHIKGKTYSWEEAESEIIDILIRVELEKNEEDNN